MSADDYVALLPALAAGDRVATLALLEPGQRYEWRTPATRAARPAEGSWSLTGTKVHVPDAGEAHRAAVMAKAFASDALPTACADAMQAHGGIGVTWEYDLHLFYKRCLSMQSAYGAAAEHYEDVASIIVDQPLETAWTGSRQ